MNSCAVYTTALGGLQGMLITQLMQDLNECAMSNGGVLPIRTEIYLDEICNIHPAIPSLESSLTISRSRGIRYVLAIQSYSQLCGVYESAAETIAANCSTWIALNIAKDESWLAAKRPHSVMKNIPFIAEYGRWDDILSLLGTPCEAAAVQAIREQLQKDLASHKKDEPISLLAKWLPSVNTSSEDKRNQAKLLSKRLKMTEKAYRQTLSRLRTHLDVLEKRLCEKDYTFDYSKQPSGAMHKYRQAFFAQRQRTL